MKSRKRVRRSVVMANLLLVGCLTLSSAFAAFDPDVLGQSTVRITIKQGDVIRSAATGFVWKKPTQIVTSLHVLHHDNAVVIIEFNGIKRIAKVAQVLPRADLVLLEVEEAIDGWVPLTEKMDDKPPYKAPITALGFNAGASGSMTRELHKGHANPEKLEGLLPPDDRKDLEDAKIPAIDLDIYYLQGSLLPGFSGSPVVDADGKLIGIGDGGLEDGASNVSWVIPARFLDDLTASEITDLPGNLEKAGQLMSADIMNVESYEDLDYEELNYEGFVFIKTKTRSFDQILASARDPDGLLEVLSLFDGYKVRYDDLYFDIYEDVDNGLIITMPAGVGLVVDEGFMREADDAYGEDSDYSYSIFFEVYDFDSLVKDHHENIRYVMHDKADDFLQYLTDGPNGEFVEFEGARILQDYGEDRYVLRSAFNNFDDETQPSHEINYMTVATDMDIAIEAEGQLNRFDDEFRMRYDFNKGTDCTAPDIDIEQQYVCDEITKMLKILASVHMITFANSWAID